MKIKSLILSILFCFCSFFVFADGFPEFTGTRTSDFSISSSFNSVPRNQTLTVSNNSTFTLVTDIVIYGTLIIEKGSSFVAAKDGEGYLCLKKGCSVEGVNFYYRTRLDDNKIVVRKIPISIKDAWKDQDICDYLENVFFVYDKSRNAWVTGNDPRYGSPFHENLYDQIEEVWDKSGNFKPYPQYKSLVIKNNAKINMESDPQVRSIKIEQSLIVEKGSSLTNVDGKREIDLKQGAEVQGLSLYASYNNVIIKIECPLSALWECNAFGNDEYIPITYRKDLGGWYFRYGIDKNALNKELQTFFDSLLK